MVFIILSDFLLNFGIGVEYRPAAGRRRHGRFRPRSRRYTHSVTPSAGRSARSCVASGLLAAIAANCWTGWLNTVAGASKWCCAPTRKTSPSYPSAGAWSARQPGSISTADSARAYEVLPFTSKTIVYMAMTRIIVRSLRLPNLFRQFLRVFKGTNHEDLCDNVIVS
jgi:hypothetical protein